MQPKEWEVIVDKLMDKIAGTSITSSLQCGVIAHGKEQKPSTIGRLDDHAYKSQMSAGGTHLNIQG